MSSEDSAPLPCVIDVETTTKCPIGNNKASPFWPENRIVLFGQKAGDQMAMVEPERLSAPNPDAKLFAIGHSIGFDIHYCLKEGKLTPERLATMQIWDTQLAEYLLSGQQMRFPSLDECAKKRGGTLKDDRVTVMFKAGKGADEVPRNMLAEYLEADLENTEKVFWSQYAEAMDRGMLPLLWSQMDARLATIEMTYNGLALDRDFLKKRTEELTEEVDELKAVMCGFAEGLTKHKLDPTSPAQLATVLYGGTVKEKVREPDGLYKNGNPKFKTLEKVHTVKGLGLMPPAFTDGGKPSTSDETLDQLARVLEPGSREETFVGWVRSYREKSKQLSTYFEGLDRLIFPDGLIHHNLNHCVTVTGRLSSSEPNLQNQDNAADGVKRAFVSRWGDDGCIVEADYSQLEIVMLAVLSGDKQLMEDIRTGTDMHAALFESMYGYPLTKDKRKTFKRCSFCLVYGGGAPAIAAQGKISKEDAKRFIETFYDRYTGVRAWHEKMAWIVKANRVYEGDKDKETGKPIGKSYYNSPFSKRQYVFREYTNDEKVVRWKKEEASFSPTEVKNYPVQGGATGDIVPLVVGKLFRVLKNNPDLKDKCLMVNTVHDSIVFDVHKDVLWQAMQTIKCTMESAPKYIKQTFDFDFPLELKAGISYGPNWFDQTEVSNDELFLREAA